MKGQVTNPVTDRRCKLNFASVAFIRKSRNKTLQRVLGDAFGVGQSCICKVQLFYTWKRNEHGLWLIPTKKVA